MNLTSDAQAIAESTPDLPPIPASLAEALVAVAPQLTVIAAGRTADMGLYKYDYADLGDLVKHTRAALHNVGVIALTPVHAHDGGLACTVILIHKSGDSMRLGPLPFPRGKDAQATGSMITYHRRYALAAALGMAVGEDDDGASAVAQQPGEAAADRETLKALQTRMAALPDASKLERSRLWTLPPLKDLTVSQAAQAEGIVAGLEARAAAGEWAAEAPVSPSPASDADPKATTPAEQENASDSECGDPMCHDEAHPEGGGMCLAHSPF